MNVKFLKSYQAAKEVCVKKMREGMEAQKTQSQSAEFSRNKDDREEKEVKV